MVTSGYQLADLEDIELQWEAPDMKMDANIRPCLDTTFFLSNSNDFEMGSMPEKPILIEEEQDKENSPPLPVTPVSEKPTFSTDLVRSRPFGLRFEKIPDYV